MNSGTTEERGAKPQVAADAQPPPTAPANSTAEDEPNSHGVTTLAALPLKLWHEQILMGKFG